MVQVIFGQNLGGRLKIKQQSSGCAYSVKNLRRRKNS